MCCFFTEDLRVSMVVGWDDLVPGADSFVSGLLRKLLCHSGLSGTGRVDFHDAEVQFLSILEEGSVSYRGPHSRNPYRAHWFPRCHSFGADDDRGRKCTRRPIGMGVCCGEPWVAEDEIVRPHVSDIKAGEMGNVSCDHFEFGEVFQASSGVRGSVGVLEFARGVHEAYPQLVLVDEALTDETFGRSTVEESNVVGLFLCGV